MDVIPLVSVCVITYNQETTISQTLDSILNQKINFPVEIIIGEDCSTDNTRQICIEYQNKYPQLIRLILQEQNQGILRNYKSVINACKGKYIAQCAGDDYWHNRDKLKLQVDFLENNIDYGLVHTNAYLLYVKNNKIKKIRCHNIPDRYIYESLLENGNHIFTPTVLFRRQLMVDYVNLDEYINQGFMMEDYPTWLELSQHTKFFYMNFSTAVYRVNANSASFFSTYTQSVLFEDNVYKIQNFFYSKYSDNINLKKIETSHSMRLWIIALKFNVQKDIIFYSKYLPDKTIKQKIKKYLMRYKIFRFIVNLLGYFLELIFTCKNVINESIHNHSNI